MVFSPWYLLNGKQSLQGQTKTPRASYVWEKKRERRERTSELHAELVVQVSDGDGLVGQAVLDENVRGLQVTIGTRKRKNNRNGMRIQKLALYSRSCNSKIQENGDKPTELNKNNEEGMVSKKYKNGYVPSNACPSQEQNDGRCSRQRR